MLSKTKENYWKIMRKVIAYQWENDIIYKRNNEISN